MPAGGACSHDAKGILGKRMLMHLLPGTNSTYMMLTRGCMHAPLSIKKVMSMQCVCMHPLAIIILYKIICQPLVLSEHACGSPSSCYHTVLLGVP